MHHDHRHHFSGTPAIQELIKTGKIDQRACSHLELIQEVIPSAANGCEDCLSTGDEWVNLRICLVCGHVGCCDNSPNRHATRHFHTTGHPLIQSFEPDEEWVYCYADDAGMNLD